MNIPEKAQNELDKLLKGNKNFINGTPTAKICAFQHYKNSLYIKNLTLVF